MAATSKGETTQFASHARWRADAADKMRPLPAGMGARSSNLFQY
jgi:hypothetical protein